MEAARSMDIDLPQIDDDHLDRIPELLQGEAGRGYESDRTLRRHVAHFLKEMASLIKYDGIKQMQLVTKLIEKMNGQPVTKHTTDIEKSLRDFFQALQERNKGRFPKLILVLRSLEKDHLIKVFTSMCGLIPFLQNITEGILVLVLDH